MVGLPTQLLSIVLCHQQSISIKHPLVKVPQKMNNFLLENVFTFSQLKASVEDLILHVDNFHLPSRPFADPFCTFALLDTDLSLIRVVLSAVPPEN